MTLRGVARRFGAVAVVVVAALGAAFGAAVMLGDWATFEEYSSRERRFLGRAETKFWLALVFAQTALWAVLAGPLWRAATAGRRRSPGDVVASSLVLLAVTAVALAVLSTWVASYPLPHHEAKIGFLTVIGALLALLGAYGAGNIWHEATLRLGDDGLELAEFRALAGRLQLLLGLVGAILGSAILGGGALRNAVVSWTGDADDFPYEYVLAYGGVLSALLALIWAPAFLALRELGASLLDRAAPLPAPTDPSWPASVEKRSAVEAYLELNLTATQRFRAAVAILTPLLTGALTLLLEQ